MTASVAQGFSVTARSRLVEVGRRAIVYCTAAYSSSAHVRQMPTEPSRGGLPGIALPRVQRPADDVPNFHDTAGLVRPATVRRDEMAMRAHMEAVRERSITDA